MDNRGQAMGIARFLLAAGVGAILVFLMTEITTPLLDTAHDKTSAGSVYREGNEWLQLATDPQTLLLWMLLVSLFGLVAYSVFRREMLR